MNSPFQLLCAYLKEQMRMSHIYQPVMIKRLLIDGGKAKDEGYSSHKYETPKNVYQQVEYIPASLKRHESASNTLVNHITNLI